jgi:hypothetical protein
MERPDQERDDTTPETLGEDHRGDPPGYDLDEQEAIEKLKHEREGQEDDEA